MENRLIFRQIAFASRKIKAVHMSNMQRFKARHIYDVYNMLQPVLAEAGLVISRDLLSEREREVESQKGTKGTHRFQVWRFRITAEDGSYMETTFPAESIDWADKSSSQCDAMAFKQMLIHTFIIPTEQKDPDDKPQDNIKPTNQMSVTQNQIKRLFAICKASSVSKPQLDSIIKDKFDIDSVMKLNRTQYDELCEFVGDMKNE